MGIETLFGTYDENLKYLATQFGVKVRTQGHDVIVEGPPADVSKVERLFTQLGALLEGGIRSRTVMLKPLRSSLPAIPTSTFANIS